MKLDRNITKPRRGKYALLGLRSWPHGWPPECQAAFEILRKAGAIDFGESRETDFFVIRLKDKYAAPALAAYALAAYRDDPEYAVEVLNLAMAAAEHPNQRQPD